MRALIVGGGIAGPACAIALAKTGIEATVLERRAVVNPDEGSYLTLAPNGLDALETLGVLNSVVGAGFPSRWNDVFSSDGRLIGRLPLGGVRTDGLTALTVKRSRLAAELHVAAREVAEVRCGVTVLSVSEDACHGATVTLDDGSVEHADLVIGADGVHSPVRKSLDPDGPSPRYLGLTNFGGYTTATAWADRLAPEAWHFVFGARCFFGAHPTPAGDVAWFVNVPEAPIRRQDRSRIDQGQWRKHLLNHMQADAGPAVELVSTGELELVGDNTYDLAHVPRWHSERVVLAGDAVHAPSPSSGQGASLALEDAIVLAQALRDNDQLPAAFEAYERRRRSRVERVVKAAARTSSSKIPGPFGRHLRDATLRVVFRHLVTERSTAWMTQYRNPWDSSCR